MWSGTSDCRYVIGYLIHLSDLTSSTSVYHAETRAACMMHQFLLKYPPFFHKSAKFKFSEDDIVDKIVEEHLFKMSSIMKVSYPRYEPLFSNACRVMFKD